MTIWVLGTSMLLLVIWFIATESGHVNQIVIMGLLALLLLGYSISYEFTNDYNNKRHYKIFGFSVFKSRLKLFYPEYMTIFSAKFKQVADWGPIGALGNERKGDDFVLRLFRGNQHFTVYRTKSLERARTRAKELSELLEVEIRGKI